MKHLLLLLLTIPCLSPAAPTAFLKPPQYVAAPDAAHSVDNRGITMVPSLAITPKGRIWATWYAGVTPGEDPNNYVVLATSGDNGKSWEEVLVVDPDGSGPVRAYDPEVWMAPDGNIYLIWAQGQGNANTGSGTIGGVWAIKVTNPEKGELEYEAPVRWTDGVMMCKPIVLTTGEWVLPASTWRQTDFSARMVVSTDQGKSWTVRGASHVPKEHRDFDEHMIVERKDKSLWMLARTRYGIGESTSSDRGKTWSEMAPSGIPHPPARFFIHRLNSGNLLLVKHGGMHKKTGRSHLRAFVSKDDGLTWQGGLLLDEREKISYPDGQEAADGTIYITYDRSRTDAREILMASFREEDALAAENISGKVKLRQLISKGSGGKAKKPKGAIKRRSNDDGVGLKLSPTGAIDSASHHLKELKVGEKIFSDRSYTLNELPQQLEGFSYLQVSIENTNNYRCSEDGMLYFLTPQTNRNRDSQEASLIKQGFEKVALPELLLFSLQNNKGQLCSLYQKECKKGETIHLNKWALPIFAPSLK